MQYRNTRQRQAVLDAIERHGGHLTADQIYAAVRKQFPRVSLGTVYRNLRVLLAHGSIRELRLGTSFSYFEKANEPHHHLICRVCGQLTDAEFPVSRQIQKIVERSQRSDGFLIEEHRLDFIGVCARCQHKSSRSRVRHRATQSR